MTADYTIFKHPSNEVDLKNISHFITFDND